MGQPRSRGRCNAGGCSSHTSVDNSAMPVTTAVTLWQSQPSDVTAMRVTHCEKGALRSASNSQANVAMTQGREATASAVRIQNHTNKCIASTLLAVHQGRAVEPVIGDGHWPARSKEHLRRRLPVGVLCQRARRAPVGRMNKCRVSDSRLRKSQAGQDQRTLPSIRQRSRPGRTAPAAPRHPPPGPPHPWLRRRRVFRVACSATRGLHTSREQERVEQRPQRT